MPFPLAAQETASEHSFTANLDDVIDWAAPFDTTESHLAETWAQEGFKSSPLYSQRQQSGSDVLRIGEHPYRNISVALSALGGAARVVSGQLEFKDKALQNIALDLAPQPETTLLPALESRWPNAEKRHTPFVTSAGQTGSITVLRTPSARVTLTVFADQAPHLQVEKTGTAPTPITFRGKIGNRRTPDDASTTPDAAEDGFISVAELDFLLAGDRAWKIQPQDLDQRYAMEGREKPLHFEWLDSTHSRARFSRRPFSNVEVILTLCEGQIVAEEANLDFENDHLARVTLSVFNVGDSGEISTPAFEQIIRTCGRTLGQVLGVSPKEQRQQGRGPVAATVGWAWATPHTLALMEHNDLNAKNTGRRTGSPEFVRIKIASAEYKDWFLGIKRVGETSTTVSRAGLVNNVQHEANGDVVITNVPMVDQGPKGYCVVASCQRLFEYYHIAFDQHQLAQVVGTTADGGTLGSATEEGLDKIDSLFKTRFKSLISYRMDSRDREKLNADRFKKMIRDSIDQGIPLLWSLGLGQMREDPPLPQSGQISGGHMRLIIGYNDAQQRVIFSDSWGAGHEKKSADMRAAFACTHGLYSLTPRSY
ncbi:MAG: C39 family peptidase [Verrucomicrobiales bacterium]|nr:C39 family peptidase [Verrucomicrobiales bacterium]